MVGQQGIANLNNALIGLAGTVVHTFTGGAFPFSTAITCERVCVFLFARVE